MKRFKRQHATAINGQEALDKFRLNPSMFCCILMDINMPVMDGLESTRHIRKFERHHKLDPVTIIAITGLGSQSAREEAFASGLDLFLTRPVRMNELHNILKERGLNLDPTKQEARKDESKPANAPTCDGSSNGAMPEDKTATTIETAITNGLG